MPDAPGAGRVVAGRARGIRLLGVGERTRPLGDRVKQTLFAILDPDLRGSAVLDLFAGTGAAGIEALSRGAARVVFVERDPEAVRVIRANLDRTHLAGSAAVVEAATLPDWLRRAGRSAERGAAFDIVVVDPPYDEPALLASTLEAVGPWVVPGGRVVAKHAAATPPPPAVGLLASERERRFGPTGLTFFRRTEGR